ncbi:MAG: Holliday junction resolvase RuvX [Gammaproteobacteria bacterium]|nr:Holliday junction resolvase RuvX [Gammaproteobacteria bacterium]
MTDTSPVALPPGGIVLGFDYGTRRIGVAIGEQVTGGARPLPALVNRRAPDWQTLGRLIEQWQPQACVVGLPLDQEGGRQPITRQAETFAEQLRRRYGLPVYLCDERFSSRAADDELRQARSDGRIRRRLRKSDRDGMAARLILEQFLDSSAGTQRR